MVAMIQPLCFDTTDYIGVIILMFRERLTITTPKLWRQYYLRIKPLQDKVFQILELKILAEGASQE